MPSAQQHLDVWVCPICGKTETRPKLTQGVYNMVCEHPTRGGVIVMEKVELEVPYVKPEDWQVFNADV